MASGVAAADRPPRTSPRPGLTLADRAAIQEGVRVGRSLRATARDLGFSRPAVSREVARASERGRYEFSRAQRPSHHFWYAPRVTACGHIVSVKAYVQLWTPRYTPLPWPP